VRLNIPDSDATKDVLIQGALDAALDLVENYLDRKLEYKEETEHYYDVSQHTLLAKRYPIESVKSSTTVLAQIDLLKGIFHFGGGERVHEVTVVYTGGFKMFPSSLLLALWSVFDTVWADFGAAGSASASTSGGPPVKSLKLGELGISFGTDSSASSSGSSGDFFSPVSIALLSPYRRWTA